MGDDRGGDWIAGSSQLLQRICGACLDRVAVDGLSVSVAINSGIRIPVFASDSVAEQLESLQFELGEGPSVDVLASQRPVHVDDLQARDALARWPAFTIPALAVDVHAVFGYPLRLGGARLGGLLMYRRTPTALTLGQQAAALRFADATFYAVLEALSGALVEAGPDGADVEAALMSGAIPLYRAEIHQAAGMVMGQLALSIEQATVRLRAYAFARDRPLIDVARDIIGRELRLDDDNGPHRPLTDRSRHD